LFNRKSTAFKEQLAQLTRRVDRFESRLKETLSDNNRKYLEFAELGEKMRRTYLRLSRIVKIDSEQSSAPDVENNGESEKNIDPREIRDAIERSM